MYRGQDIGNREQLIEKCLEILRTGNEEDRYKVLPHMSVTRSAQFLEPLLEMLDSGELRDKEFAALALGALGNPAAVKPLFAFFRETDLFLNDENRQLETALIFALGEIGDESAVDLLFEVYDMRFPGKVASNSRKRSVLSALGMLAQQGCDRAVEKIMGLALCDGLEMQVQAVNELSVAYWHRVNQVPDSVLQVMVKLSESQREELQKAAVTALSTLANLGCTKAESYFSASS